MQREPENASSSVSCCALSYGLKCVSLSATQRVFAVEMLVALNAALNSLGWSWDHWNRLSKRALMTFFWKVPYDKTGRGLTFMHTHLSLRNMNI